MKSHGAARESGVRRVVEEFVRNINEHDVEGLFGLMHEDHVFIDAHHVEARGARLVRNAWKQYLERLLGPRNARAPLTVASSRSTSSSPTNSPAAIGPRSESGEDFIVASYDRQSNGPGIRSKIGCMMDGNHLSAAAFVEV